MPEVTLGEDVYFVVRAGKSRLILPAKVLAMYRLKPEEARIDLVKFGAFGAAGEIDVPYYDSPRAREKQRGWVTKGDYLADPTLKAFGAAERDAPKPIEDKPYQGQEDYFAVARPVSGSALDSSRSTGGGSGGSDG